MPPRGRKSRSGADMTLFERSLGWSTGLCKVRKERNKRASTNCGAYLPSMPTGVGKMQTRSANCRPSQIICKRLVWIRVLALFSIYVAYVPHSAIRSKTVFDSITSSIFLTQSPYWHLLIWSATHSRTVFRHYIFSPYPCVFLVFVPVYFSAKIPPSRDSPGRSDFRWQKKTGTLFVALILYLAWVAICDLSAVKILYVEITAVVSTN